MNAWPAAAPLRVVIVGGGVHATVVVDCIRRGGVAELIGYTDIPNHDPRPMKAMNVSFLGTDAWFEDDHPQHHAVAAILGIGDADRMAARRKAALAIDPFVERWFSAVHPGATIADSATLGDGTLVLAGAVINPLAIIGRHGVINTAAVVEHHAVVDDFVLVSPHATLCGGVHVGEGSFIGAGATIITDVNVGKNVIVGAGAVVLDDVSDGCVVVGNPARPVRTFETPRLHAHAVPQR